MSVSRRLHAVPRLRYNVIRHVSPEGVGGRTHVDHSSSRRVPSHWTWPMRRDRTLSVLLSLSLLPACSDPIARAEEALEIGDYALAEQVLSHAVRSQPRDAEIRRLLLLTFEAIGQTDRALATAKVLGNLDPSPTNAFLLARLEAQVGDILVAKALLDQWPSDSVSSLARRVALQRDDTTLVIQPGFLRSLGVGDHTTAQVLVLIHEHTGDDDYSVTDEIALAVEDLADIAPELVRVVRESVEAYLSAMPEPNTRYPSLFVINQPRYYRATGRLLAAVGNYEKAIQTFERLEVFVGVMYQTGRAGRNGAFQLMYAMGERIDLYSDLGRDEEGAGSL